MKYRKIGYIWFVIRKAELKYPFANLMEIFIYENGVEFWTLEIYNYILIKWNIMLYK